MLVLTIGVESIVAGIVVSWEKETECIDSIESVNKKQENWASDTEVIDMEGDSVRVTISLLWEN